MLGMKKRKSYQFKSTVNNAWTESYGCENSTDSFYNCQFTSNSVGAVRFTVDGSKEYPILNTDYNVADCGDDICEPGEACETCPQDCGYCPMPVCGNRICEDYHGSHPESCVSCPADCGLCPTEPVSNTTQIVQKQYNLKWLMNRRNNLFG